MWDFYDPRADEDTDEKLTWRDVLGTYWEQIEGGLPFDLTTELLASRTARWLRVRILNLLQTDSALSRAIQSDREKAKRAAVLDAQEEVTA